MTYMTLESDWLQLRITEKERGVISTYLTAVYIYSLKRKTDSNEILKSYKFFIFYLRIIGE
jgi:hypothetical protein